MKPIVCFYLLFTASLIHGQISKEGAELYALSFHLDKSSRTIYEFYREKAGCTAQFNNIEDSDSEKLQVILRTQTPGFFYNFYFNEDDKCTDFSVYVISRDDYYSLCDAFHIDSNWGSSIILKTGRSFIAEKERVMEHKDTYGIHVSHTIIPIK